MVGFSTILVVLFAFVFFSLFSSILLFVVAISPITRIVYLSDCEILFNGLCICFFVVFSFVFQGMNSDLKMKRLFNDFRHFKWDPFCQNNISSPRGLY